MVFVYPTVHARKVLLRNFHHCGGPAKLVHACLTESSFHNCGGPVKLLLGLFECQEGPWKLFSQLSRFCEAHAGEFGCQERSRKQLSPPLRSCEDSSHHSHVKEDPDTCRQHSWGPVKLVHACLRPTNQFSPLWWRSFLTMKLARTSFTILNGGKNCFLDHYVYWHPNWHAQASHHCHNGEKMH